MVWQCGWNVASTRIMWSHLGYYQLRAQVNDWTGTDTVDRLSTCCPHRSLWNPVSVDSAGHWGTGLSLDRTLETSICSLRLFLLPRRNPTDNYKNVVAQCQHIVLPSAYICAVLTLTPSFDLWPFGLKIGKPVIPAPRNSHTNFGFVCLLVVLLGQTDGWTCETVMQPVKTTAY